MHYDYRSIYEKNAAFFHARPTAKKALIWCNRLLPYFFLFAYLLLWGYAVGKDVAPKTLVKLFCCPAVALLLVSALRLGIFRYRPYDEKGAGIEPLQEKKGSSTSFPSRHLTSAAVLAVVAFPILPAVGGLLCALCPFMGYCRFALGWHYPSDLLAGLALGALCGLGIFLPL